MKQRRVRQESCWDEACVLPDWAVVWSGRKRDGRREEDEEKQQQPKRVTKMESRQQ